MDIAYVNRPPDTAEAMDCWCTVFSCLSLWRRIQQTPDVSHFFDECEEAMYSCISNAVETVDAGPCFFRGGPVYKSARPKTIFVARCV